MTPELTVAVGAYDRTLPLMAGIVRIDGVDARFVTAPLEEPLRARRVLAPPPALDLRRQKEVVQHGAPVEQQVGLEHDADLRVRPPHLLAVDQDAA